MPPKKENKAGADGEVEGEDPMVMQSNYTKFCKSVGLAAHTGIVRALADEEKYPIEQLIVDDEFGLLGPGGARALCTSLMGAGPGMKGGPYKLMKSLRFWRCNVNDEGTNAIAEVLRLGGAEVKIGYLELLDCNIGARGCLALGNSLCQGKNLSLLTLKLDYNSNIGATGTFNLCRGLRTNMSLKQLHMQFCNITHEAGGSIGDLLGNAKSALELLNLAGNRLTGVGLSQICRGLMTNTKLETLSLSDNMIDQNPEDLQGIEAFRDCLNQPNLALTSVDLMFNRIGEAGALVLAQAITPENKKINEFLVDITIPLPLFEQICRKGGGKKKGKKGKKK